MPSLRRRFFVIMPPRHFEVSAAYFSPWKGAWTDNLHEAGQFRCVDDALAVGEEWMLPAFDVQELEEHELP